MGRKRIYDFEDLSGDLFDLLAGSADGLTIYEIAEELGVPVHAAREVLRVLRLALGGSDSIAVPVTTDSRKRRYSLSADVAPDGAVRNWSRARSKSAAANLDVDIATWKSMARAHEGQPMGHISRLVAKALTRAQEDIRELFSTEVA